MSETPTDQPEPLYCIAWVNKLTGAHKRGTNKFTFREASRLARELNDDYPNIEHTVEQCQPNAS